MTSGEGPTNYSQIKLSARPAMKRHSRGRNRNRNRPGRTTRVEVLTIRPAFSTLRANSAFSDRKPYPIEEFQHLMSISSTEKCASLYRETREVAYQDGSSGRHAPVRS